VSAMVGGSVSYLAGGKFGNGAATGAFQMAFGELVDFGTSKGGASGRSGSGKKQRGRGPDLNLDPPGSWEESSDNRMYNNPDVFDLAAHGNPQEIEDGPTGGTIRAPAAARMIRANANFVEGMPVQLFACSTGAGVNSFAQQLARQLDVLVIAPTTDIQVWPLGGYHFNRTEVKAGGRWKLFSPAVLKPQFDRPRPTPTKELLGN
jgi:hypothetical protein